MNKELRIALGVAAKLNEELKLALEQAQRQRDEAREDAKWMSKYATKEMDCLIPAQVDQPLQSKTPRWMPSYDDAAADMRSEWEAMQTQDCAATIRELS